MRNLKDAAAPSAALATYADTASLPPYLVTDPTRVASHLVAAAVEAGLQQTAPGIKAARFRLELRTAVPAAPPKDVMEAAAAGNRGRGLIVEDSPDGLRTLVELIESNGHALLGFPDGLAALRAAGEWQPDLSLLDLGLPSMDGYEVEARLRSDLSLKDTPIVSLTGWGSEQDRAKLPPQASAPTSRKPVLPAKLLQLIDDLLEPRGSGRPVLDDARKTPPVGILQKAV